jgi:hypothetical protein
MTEKEWLDSTDPHLMLHFLRDRASERKTRLFACALARCLWPLLGTGRSRRAVEAAERFADGLAPKREMTRAGAAAQQAAWTVWRVDSRPKDGRNVNALRTARYAAYATFPFGPQWISRHAVSAGVSAPFQSALLHDLFGPLPFRPVSLTPAVLAWNDATVARLARATYEERHMPEGTLDNARLAVLADALEEAGCSDADILGHLRGLGPHVRGCWIVDLLLGKG